MIRVVDFKIMFICHTRFSLYSPRSRAWVASNGLRLAVEEYKSYLFSSERMDPRCEIFFNYTLPMLALASEGVLFRHIVSYSADLPIIYRKQLIAAEKLFPFLVLDLVEPGGGSMNVPRYARSVMQEEDISATTVFGLMRLDDDDVLSGDYFSQMEPYVKEANVGFVVSLARGVTAIYNDGQFFYARDAIYRLHSKGLLGVCRFDKSGRLSQPLSADHNKSDRYNPVILDSRKFSHLWVRSTTQDTSLYQYGEGPDATMDRIYKEMGQYPQIAISLDNEFPLLANKLHITGPRTVTK